MNNKKSDLIVWDEKKGYYAKELTYGTNLGAPAIRLEDIDGWKKIQADKANKIFNENYNEIKKNFEFLIKEIEWNELVYSSEYNFMPVVGEIYYLYSSKEVVFLSLIKPEEWNLKFLGATKLDSNNKWIKL